MNNVLIMVQHLPKLQMGVEEKFNKSLHIEYDIGYYEKNSLFKRFNSYHVHLYTCYFRTL